MSGAELLDFTSGAIAMGYAVVSWWFYCSWRRNRIGLVFSFGIAFFLLAAERVVLVFGEANDEYKPFIYLIRLAAFLIIIAGIVNHNRRPT